MHITTLSFISIALCISCSLLIVIDLIYRPQKMQIMNIVWPVTALYSGLLGLLLYYYIGRQNGKDVPKGEMDHKGGMENTNMKNSSPLWQSVLKGALHCGSGCTLGDLISAVMLLYVPVTIMHSRLLGDWAIEYLFAFVIGIIFQYYAIKPMKHINSADALKAALKADALSLTFWQVGMYGWMAICNYLLFHRQLTAREPVFWFMMQVGMLCGLLTAYPINWWLIKKGIKESM